MCIVVVCLDTPPPKKKSALSSLCLLSALLPTATCQASAILFHHPISWNDSNHIEEPSKVSEVAAWLGGSQKDLLWATMGGWTGCLSGTYQLSPLLPPCCPSYWLPAWETEIATPLMLMNEAQLNFLFITFWRHTPLSPSKAKAWIHSTSTKTFTMFHHSNLKLRSLRCILLNIFALGWCSLLQDRWRCSPDPWQKTGFVVGPIYARGEAVCALNIQFA